MGLHPYPFKWRWPPHFPGLLVMIIRHMRKARELDDKINQSASNTERLVNEMKLLKSKLGSIQGELKKEKGNSKEKRVKNLKKEVNQKIMEIEKERREMKKEVSSFCKDVRSELKDFKRNDIDDYTLLYRGTKYLKELAKILVASKNMNKTSKGELKRIIKSEMRSMESKADALELQAKYLERGVANPVVLSQISPLGNRYIEGRIRRKAIEISHLYGILKSKKDRNLPGYFEKMIADIYEIGRNTNMLMRRLKSTFNSVKTKLKASQIYFPELDETQRFFATTFNRMNRISKRLENEMGDQAVKLESILKKVA